jgi:hypothetical protein
MPRPKTGGRKKGTPNKTTAVLKDAILLAAEQAGDADGLVGYLKKQATDNPQSFLPLLGKVLPMQVGGDPDNPVRHAIEVYIVDPSDKG